MGPRAIAVSVAALGLLAAPSAEAFCRTTTEPLPPSFSPTDGCFEEGLPLFWKNACISYSLQEDASAQIGYDDAVVLVHAAFAAWTSAACDEGQVGISASDLGSVACSEVRYNSSGGNQNVIIFRDSEWPYPNDSVNTLGLTTITFNSETGEIFDADLEINASGRNLSTGETVPSNGFDLLSVLTHEVGHFFGLAHAEDSRSTMFASYRPGSTALRSLTEDDISGICSIYPTGAMRTVSENVSPNGLVAADACDSEPRHGFVRECQGIPSTSKKGCAASPSSAGDAGASGSAFTLAAGLVFILRRRRSRAASSASRA